MQDLKSRPAARPLRLVVDDELAPVAAFRRSRPAAVTAPAVDLLDRLRSELEQARAERDQLAVSREEAEARLIRAWSDGYNAGEYGSGFGFAPVELETALRYGQPDVEVTVGAHRVTVILADSHPGTIVVDRGVESAVWHRICVLVDQFENLPAGTAGMWRGELPAQVAALVWHRGGEPVMAVSLATRRAELRQALHAAGHDVIGSAS